MDWLPISKLPQGLVAGEEIVLWNKAWGVNVVRVDDAEHSILTNAYTGDTEDPQEYSHYMIFRFPERP